MVVVGCEDAVLDGVVGAEVLVVEGCWVARSGGASTGAKLVIGDGGTMSGRGRRLCNLNRLLSSRPGGRTNGGRQQGKEHGGASRPCGGGGYRGIG